MTSDLSLRTGRDTYRYLRGGMVVVVVMLFAAVLIDSVPGWHWQDSISAYYYTAAHNVFVAALCCLGILLIVYKGSADAEDVLLNLAGTLAFFVAFVPIKIPDQQHANLILPTGDERLAGIENNVGAVVVALIAAATLIAFVYLVDRDSRSDTTPWGNWLRLNSTLILAGFVAVFLVAPKLFQATAHYVAAIMIFVIMAGVVFFNAYLVTKQDEPDAATREGYRRRYRVIGWMMVGSFLAAFAIPALGRLLNLDATFREFPLFALETVLLVEFAAFWAVQTVELWNHTDRRSMIAPATQQNLAFC